MLTLNADAAISINDQGCLVIQSFWQRSHLAVYGRAKLDLLLAVIEDNICYDDDGAHINWPAVEAQRI